MSKEVIAAVLVVHADGREERFVLRDQEELRIGREESNDILIPEAGVSRFHATLAGSPSGVVLSDCASLNGTFINGIKLSGMRDVGSSDKVQIGGAKIQLQLVSEQASGVARSTRTRAMTAQMNPVSVSAMVLSLKSKDAQGVLERAVLQLWIDIVEDIIKEFDGVIDKKIGSVVVGLWIGDDARNQALRAIRTFQRISSAMVESFPSLELYAALASGLGLKGLSAQEGITSEFSIVGDPVNSAFAMSEFHDAPEVKRGCVANILIDKQTGEHIKSSVDLAPLGKISGYQEPLFTLPS